VPVEPVLSELEPAPEGVLLPGLEFPPLPASPPDPGRAVPLVLAPLVPAGLEESLESDEDAPVLLASLELAAIKGSDNRQVNPAIANV
jgi:hypothetical protein